MNKWEDSLKKTLGNDEKECHCSTNQGLFVPNRQLSFIVAGLLFVFFSLFMCGYFLGKKNVISQLSEKLEQDAFADHIYTTVIATQAETQKDVAPIATAIATVEITETLPQAINQEIVSESVGLLSGSEKLSADRYYAQLIGFGTEKAAQLFIKKLAAKGIETEMRKRSSKTAHGKTSHWYQVVTIAHNNKDDLLALVEKIAKEENIKDICVRSC